MNIRVNFITQILLTKGGDRYGMEAVSQLEHALQCATLAERNGSTSELVVASLLHDFGHLVHSLGEDAAERGIDDRRPGRRPAQRPGDRRNDARRRRCVRIRHRK